METAKQGGIYEVTYLDKNVVYTEAGRFISENDEYKNITVKEHNYCIQFNSAIIDVDGRKVGCAFINSFSKLTLLFEDGERFILF